MKVAGIVNIFAYLLLWMGVVQGAAAGDAWWECLALVGYLVAHTLCFVPGYRLAFGLMLATSFVWGAFMETLFANAWQVLDHADPTPVIGLDIAPFWVILLYPLYTVSCSLFANPLKPRPFLCFALGFIFAPLSYYSASWMGAASLPENAFLTWTVIGVSWGISFLFLTRLSNTCRWYDSKAPTLAPIIFFEYHSLFNCPAEVLFAWHEQPGALKALLPSFPPVSVEQKGNPPERDSEVTLRALGLKWLARHTEFERPHFFEDIQVKGPFQLWRHRHEMSPLGEDRSLLLDRIQLTMPLSSFTHPLLGEWLLRKLETAFKQRHDRTRKALSADLD